MNCSTLSKELFIINTYIEPLSCILISRHDHVSLKTSVFSPDISGKERKFHILAYMCFVDRFVFKLIFILTVPCLADTSKYLCPLLVSYVLEQNRIQKGGHLSDLGTLTATLITALIFKHLVAPHLKKSAITS